ncbi:MAG: ABC transporter family substrate-binding protein [Salinibacterium sp.]|nr:MAG: ABC transporter family substrate-binding protein [Salinibacterium sp.]
MRTRRSGAVALLATAALILTGCTAPPRPLVAGSSVAVAWTTPFTSYNAHTTFGATSANRNITYATLSGFNYFDNDLSLVRNTTFGSYQKLSDNPLVVKYTIADGVSWSDGSAVDAADLLLQWAALSGAENTADFDPSRFADAKTGEFRALPKKVVYFDADASRIGFRASSRVPDISEDRKSITVTFDRPVADWETAMAAPLPAHIVVKHALGISDSDQAEDALIDAVRSHDVSALSKISSFWNSGFNFSRMPADHDLLVSDGPYRITGIHSKQAVTLTANPRYTGENQPKIQTIAVRVVVDPLAAVAALENNEVQVIAPKPSGQVLDDLKAIKAKTLIAPGASNERIVLQFGPSKNDTFDNPLVRRAFLKVIPRREIAKSVVAPLQKRAAVRDSLVFFPGQPGYRESVKQNGSSAYRSVDIDGAKALLDRAGGTKPTVCILFDPENPSRVEEFALIKKSAGLAGFKVTDCSSPDWRDRLGMPAIYDAALYSTTAASAEVSERDLAVFDADNPQNHNSYDNPSVTALIAKWRGETDAIERRAIERRIDTHLWHDSYGETLYQAPALTAYDEKAVAHIAPSAVVPTYFWNIWDWEPVTEAR